MICGEDMGNRDLLNREIEREITWFVLVAFKHKTCIITSMIACIRTGNQIEKELTETIFAMGLMACAKNPRTITLI